MNTTYARRYINGKNNGVLLAFLAWHGGTEPVQFTYRSKNMKWNSRCAGIIIMMDVLEKTFWSGDDVKLIDLLKIKLVKCNLRIARTHACSLKI